jgi:hemoglobin
MRTKQWWAPLGALACAAAVVAVALAQPEPKPPEGSGNSKDIDKHVYNSLRDVINHGADLYNAGDWAGCYRLYEGALMAVEPMLGHRAELQKAIRDGVQNARRNPAVDRRAFDLRGVIDRVRNDVNPNPKKPATDKPTDKPADKPADKPTDKPADKPATDTKPVTDKPGDKPADKPTDKDKPSDKPADKPADKPSDKPATDKPAGTGETVWERLGGEENVKKIVNDFVAAAATDPKVNFFRDGTKTLDDKGVANFKKQLLHQLSDLTGGPYKYDGKSMKEAHKGMGITDAEFDELAKHLEKALKKGGAKDEDIRTIMAKVGQTRGDIVEKKDAGSTKDKPTDKPTADKPADKDKPAADKPADKDKDKPADKKD